MTGDSSTSAKATVDKDHVRDAFASSVIGRAIAWLGDVVESAWRTSSTGNAARSIGGQWRATPAPRLIRTIAVAVLIAAVAQPLLISLMPRTVAPAMPWPAFALVAVFAAATAWQADAIVHAWPASRLYRVFTAHTAQPRL